MGIKKKITLIFKPGLIKDFEKIINELILILENIHPFQLQFVTKIDKRLLKFLDRLKVKFVLITNKELHLKSDLIVTLGGDGTFLGVCRLATLKSAPLFGVNMGHLGFLTQFLKNDIPSFLPLALSEKLPIMDIPLNSIKVYRSKKCVFKGFFFNDAVITKNDISRIFRLELTADDDHVYDLSGDGLIISSPVGSTAYSLAAGGPIVHPQMDCFILTPICPHSLNHRPLVIPSTFNLKVFPVGDERALALTLDGQQMFEVHPSDMIEINHRGRRNVKLLCKPNHSFFNTLKEKLTHGKI